MDDDTTSRITSSKSPNKGIKSWAKDDRPREKLLIKGVQTLSNAELLAILLRTGDSRKTALGLAQELLSSVNQDLIALSRLNVKDYTKIKGIGEVKAITLVAALELGRRRQAGSLQEKPCIRSSKDAAGLLQPLFADLRHEIFAVVFLNQANRVNHYEVISQGGMSSTVVDPKIIIRKALEQDAVKIILCHNHPSGNLQPSDEDQKLTRRLCDAATLLDMKVLDHLIVSTQGFFSFADEGLL